MDGGESNKRKEAGPVITVRYSCISAHGALHCLSVSNLVRLMRISNSYSNIDLKIMIHGWIVSESMSLISMGLRSSVIEIVTGEIESTIASRLQVPYLLSQNDQDESKIRSIKGILVVNNHKPWAHAMTPK